MTDKRQRDKNKNVNKRKKKQITGANVKRTNCNLVLQNDNNLLPSL